MVAIIHVDRDSVEDGNSGKSDLHDVRGLLDHHSLCYKTRRMSDRPPNRIIARTTATNRQVDQSNAPGLTALAPSEPRHRNRADARDGGPSPRPNRDIKSGLRPRLEGLRPVLTTHARAWSRLIACAGTMVMTVVTMCRETMVQTGHRQPRTGVRPIHDLTTR